MQIVFTNIVLYQHALYKLRRRWGANDCGVLNSGSRAIFVTMHFWSPEWYAFVRTGYIRLLRVWDVWWRGVVWCKQLPGWIERSDVITIRRAWTMVINVKTRKSQRPLHSTQVVLKSIRRWLNGKRMTENEGQNTDTFVRGRAENTLIGSFLTRNHPCGGAHCNEGPNKRTGPPINRKREKSSVPAFKS